MVVAVKGAARPIAHHILHGKHEQRHECHGQRGADAGRDGHAFLLEIFGQPDGKGGIHRAHHGHEPAAELHEPDGDKQRHGGDGNHAAQIIQDVDEGEARRVVPLRLPECPKLFGLRGGDDVLRHGLFHAAAVKFHDEHS